MKFLIPNSHFFDLETPMFAQIEWCNFTQICEISSLYFFIINFSSDSLPDEHKLRSSL